MHVDSKRDPPHTTLYMYYWSSSEYATPSSNLWYLLANKWNVERIFVAERAEREWPSRCHYGIGLYPFLWIEPFEKSSHIISICEKSLKAQQWRLSTSRHLHVNKLCVCWGWGAGGCRGCVLLRDPVFAPKRVKDLPCKVCGLIVSTFNSTEKLPLDSIGNSMSPREQLWVTCGSSFPLMESQLKCKSCKWSKWKLFLMERGSCKHSQLY